MKKQPLNEYLNRLYVGAVRAGRGYGFLDHVARMIWNGSTPGWDKGDHLKAAMAAAGLDIDAVLASTPWEAAEADLEANAAAMLAAGHWGVPLMVYRDEPFLRPGPVRSADLAVETERRPAMLMPETWRPEHKLFPHQVGFTCPPFDYDAAPSDFLRMAPDTVGVHGWMLHVPDYAHGLDQRRENFSMMEDFVHCMARNGVDVAGQVGSNWVHASGLGVDGIRQHCEDLSDQYGVRFHMAGYAMVEALRAMNVEKVALNAAYHWPDMVAGHGWLSEGGRVRRALGGKFPRSGLVRQPGGGQ